MARSGSIGAGVQRAAKTVAKRASRNVVGYGRVKTGAMRDRIRPTGRIGWDGKAATTVVVADVPYSTFQHEGTSRGIRPAPFLRDALRSLRPSDFA